MTGMVDTRTIRQPPSTIGRQSRPYNLRGEPPETSPRRTRPTNLIDFSVRELTERLASREPVPGGGSAAALAGALGSALVAMVAELTIGRRDAAEHEGQ